MIPTDLPFDASATLLWFPKGEHPKPEDFEQRIDGGGETYWFRHQAIDDAVQAAARGKRPEGRVPWIKYGDTILDERAILDQYHRLHGR